VFSYVVVVHDRLPSFITRQSAELLVGFAAFGTFGLVVTLRKYGDHSIRISDVLRRLSR